MSTFSERRFIATEIVQALRNRGLAPDSPLRAELERKAEIVDGYTSMVRVHTDSNRFVTVDQGIEDLRHDPRFSRYFPPERPHISAFDEDAKYKNFDAIRRGDVEIR